MFTFQRLNTCFLWHSLRQAQYAHKSSRYSLGRCNLPLSTKCSFWQGLRGIASFLVVIHHCTWAFAPEYRFPANSRHHRPYIFQLPFLRIVVIGGNFCVALFFFLSGYVCSLKSLRLARDGNKEAAKLVAGSSIVRRVVRLAVPATAATLVSWVFCQLGTYELARSAGGLWYNGTAAYTHGVIPAITSFFRQCVCLPCASLKVAEHLDSRTKRIRWKPMDHAA